MRTLLEALEGLVEPVEQGRTASGWKRPWRSVKWSGGTTHDPVLFSLFVQDAAGRGLMCYFVTDRQDVKQGDLPAVLFATKNALSKKDYVALLGFRPDLWIGKD